MGPENLANPVVEQDFVAVGCKDQVDGGARSAGADCEVVTVGANASAGQGDGAEQPRLPALFRPTRTVRSCRNASTTSSMPRKERTCTSSTRRRASGVGATVPEVTEAGYLRLVPQVRLSELARRATPDVGT